MPPDEVENVADSLAPPRYPFWNWIDFALVVGLLVGMICLLFVAAAVAILLLPSLSTDQGPLLLPLQLGLYVAIYLAFWLAFHFRYDMPVFASLGWQHTVSAKNLVLIGLGGLVLSPAISLIATALHTPEIHIDALEQLEKRPLILAAFGVMAVTVAPLFEELLFRGFMQPLFSRTFGVMGGILLTGLLFGGLHAPEYKWAWQYAVAISTVGCMLGVVRYRTGSIISSTVMHACYNAVAAAEILFHHKK